MSTLQTPAMITRATSTCTANPCQLPGHGLVDTTPDWMCLAMYTQWKSPFRPSFMHRLASQAGRCTDVHPPPAVTSKQRIYAHITRHCASHTDKSPASCSPLFKTTCILWRHRQQLTIEVMKRPKYTRGHPTASHIKCPVNVAFAGVILDVGGSTFLPRCAEPLLSTPGQSPPPLPPSAFSRRAGLCSRTRKIVRRQ